jgi:outer membrane protein assembly factor BamA
VATGDSFFIGAYIDPSIAGTRFKWQWDVFLRRERVLEYRPPRAFIDPDPPIVRESKMNYLNSGLTLGFSLFRSMSLEGRIRGAYVSYFDVSLGELATEEDVDPTLTMGCVEAAACELSPPGAQGYDVSTEGILEFDRRANWYGITTGNLLRLTVERSLPGLGSDFDYWYGGALLEHSRRFFRTHNLQLKLSGGYGKDMPFQQEYTSGGTSLRGYKNREFRGDVVGGANLEYSAQVINIKGFALRALLFGDVRYTRFLNPTGATEMCGEEPCRNYLPGAIDADEFPDSVDVGNEKLRYLRSSVGVGTRVYIRQIVLPLLGLDLGYGLESGGVEIYFAIGLTDF